MDQGGTAGPHDDDAPPPGWGSPDPTGPGQEAPPGPQGPYAGPVGQAGGYSGPAAGFPPPPPDYGYPPSPPGFPVAYGQPGPPAGWTSSDDRTWAMLAHLSFFVFGILGPIIIMLTKGKESPYVREQAAEALNFHITVILATIVSSILIIVIIGIFLLMAVLICGVVFSIMAAVAANRGERYRYPLNIRFVH